MNNPTIDNALLLVFEAIALRLAEARQKHPLWGEGKFYALGVIEDEFEEFKHAVLHESEYRQQQEALDVIATCVRFLQGDYKPKDDAA